MPPNPISSSQFLLRLQNKALDIMTKTEKLKEVNDTLKEMCVDLETRIFVEDMDINEDRIMKNYEVEPVEDKMII